MSDLLDLLKARYSERNFDPQKEVEEEKLYKLLEAGRVAPTASNRQAFRMYLTRGKRGKDIMSHFNAPAHIILTGIKKDAWSRKYDGFSSVALDLGIVGTHIVLEAESLGLKTCMICAFEPDRIIQGLELPIEEYPMMAIAVGYPSADSKPAPKHTERKSMDELATVVD